MNRKESLKRLIILGLSMLGICILVGIYAYTWINIYHMKIMYNIHLYFWGHILMVGIYFVLLFFFDTTYGGLKIGYLKPLEVFFSQVFSLICVNLITYFQYSITEVKLVYARPLITMTIFQIMVAALWTYCCNAFYKKSFPPRALLFIHGDRPIEDIEKKFLSRKDKYLIVKTIHIKEGLEEIKKEALHYKGVILWDLPNDDRNKLLKFCYGESIRIYLMPKITDVLIKGADQLHLFDTPILLTREYALSIEQRIAKRLLDLFCSSILIIITLPIQLIAAIIIKLYDGGPVLYKQVRCTRGQKEFQIIKFRSMNLDAEKDGVARLATKNDARITPFGKFIRAVRIDELPQLYNILKGEMSFIGPRPERPEIIAQYVKEMPEFLLRTKVKAGLAGYAQVYGKYNTTPLDKLKLDLSYIETYSIWLDLKLMMLTLKILFKAESTEGIDHNQTTAKKEDKNERKE
ncbi:MAG: exopolysaccharide biosynthesis polyprenyl glycosylphosphotransferase [Lachnospiraceae bacterium]